MTTLDRILQHWRISKARPFLREGTRVLDIGCGDGSLHRHAPSLQLYVGIDPEAIGPGLITGAFPDDLPEQEDRFDTIVLLAVLEHVGVERLESFVNAIRDRLAPSGLAVITVPSPSVDRILAVLKAIRFVEGMSLEQHHGFEVGCVSTLFAPPDFQLVTHRRFQLGLNHLFVFRRTGEDEREDSSTNVT